MLAKAFLVVSPAAVTWPTPVSASGVGMNICATFCSSVREPTAWETLWSSVAPEADESDDDRVDDPATLAQREATAAPPASAATPQPRRTAVRRETPLPRATSPPCASRLGVPLSPPAMVPPHIPSKPDQPHGTAFLSPSANEAAP